MMERRSLLCVTLGDPAGVGPELVATLMDRPRRECDFVVVGSAEVLEAAGRLIGWKQKIRRLAAAEEALDLPPGTCPVIEPAPLASQDIRRGEVDAACGRAAVAAIRMSADLAARGEVDAVVSAPVNKVSMKLAGEHYPGQTEMYLESWGLEPADGHIMLVGGKVRCSLVTGHCSMREALDRITAKRVERIARQAHATLRRHFGITAPRIGVAGVNCHAGDGGLFGTEEIEVLNPVMARLRADGMDVTDAEPPDALFHAAERGVYDSVLGMYHDQGVIPLKRTGYVTVIAGAPHIRTTCGHGTAFDIAWTGKVRPDLFLRAADLAAELARHATARAIAP